MSLVLWATRKLGNSSAFICAKDTRLYLQRANTIERAMILLGAQHFACNIEDDLRQVLAEPLAAADSVSRSAFLFLSEGINGRKAELREMIAQSRALGNPISADVARSFETGTYSLQVWGTTIAAAFSESCLSVARETWDMLDVASPHIPEAIERSKEMTARTTGRAVADDIFDAMLAVTMETLPLRPNLHRQHR